VLFNVFVKVRRLLRSCTVSDDIMCMELWWDDTDMGK
jgi:hypothetical protein